MKTTLRRTEPYKMLRRRTKPLRRRVLIEEGLAKSSKKHHSGNTDKWYLCKASSFSNSKSKPLRRRILIEEGPAKSSKKQHSENTDKWHLCKAGSFSYGESPRTPPLEGTSLHRWNSSVERPWGILSLFTTCLRLGVKSPYHRLWHVDYPRKAH